MKEMTREEMTLAVVFEQGLTDETIEKLYNEFEEGRRSTTRTRHGLVGLAKKVPHNFQLDPEEAEAAAEWCCLKLWTAEEKQNAIDKLGEGDPIANQIIRHLRR